MHFCVFWLLSCFEIHIVISVMMNFGEIYIVLIPCWRKCFYYLIKKLILVHRLLCCSRLFCFIFNAKDIVHSHAPNSASERWRRRLRHWREQRWVPVKVLCAQKLQVVYVIVFVSSDIVHSVFRIVGFLPKQTMCCANAQTHGKFWWEPDNMLLGHSMPSLGPHCVIENFHSESFISFIFIHISFIVAVTNSKDHYTLPSIQH